MTQKTDNKLLMVEQERGAGVPLALVCCMFFVVFGIYNDQNLFWAHCRIAEWSVLVFVSLFFIRNGWMKFFLLYSLFRMVLLFFQTPDPLAQKAGASAFIYFYYFFLAAIMFQTLDDVIRKTHLEIIINGMAIIAAIQTIYIWFQHFGYDPVFSAWVESSNFIHMDVKNLVVGTWAHTNFSGAYLACSVPLFLRRKLFWFVPVILVAIFWGRSWGATIACAFGIMIWAIITQKPWIKGIIITVTMFLLFTYGVMFEQKQFDFMKSDRIQYIQPTIEMIKVRPLTGWGQGQYKSAFYSISNKFFMGNSGRGHAHFDILEYVFEMGFIGLLPVVGFLATLTIHFLKNITLLSSLAFSGMVALLVNSCSTFVMHTPMFWIVLVYIIIIKKERLPC